MIKILIWIGGIIGVVFIILFSLGLCKAAALADRWLENHQSKKDE
jgi:hypothetical protein